MQFWKFAIPLFVFLFATASEVNASVVINEFLPDVESGDEWVEIYNSGTDPVDISNWTIKDDKDQLFVEIPQESTISGKEYKVFYRTNSLLNNNGDTVLLYDQNESLQNSQNYSSSPGKGISIGRYPDGSGTWLSLQNPTPNGTNTTGNPVPSPSPSPLPTPSPQADPSPSPSPSPSTTTITTTTTTTKTIAKKQSPKPTLEAVAFLDKDEDENTSQVLGEAAEDQDEDSKEATTSGFSLVKGGLLSWILTGSGALFLLAAGVPFILKKFPPGKKKSSHSTPSTTDSNTQLTDHL